jgi:3',5'-cyclic-AMP phosphodiesterase
MAPTPPPIPLPNSPVFPADEVPATPCALTLGVVTDLHFGPAAFFDGKLRKLTHRAEELLVAALAELRTAGVDAIVNLGDDLEDESFDADKERYERCQELLRSAGRPVINVAGNHDTVFLGREDLMAAWGERGMLHRSFDLGGVHLVVLHSIERKDVDVVIPPDQVAWLEEDLARTHLPTVVLVHHPLSEQDFDDSRWFARAPQLALVKNRREVRDVLRESGKVRLIVNGHVHRNHFDVVDGLPFVTVQSLVENLDEDAPGRPAAAYAIVTITDERVLVRVRGNDPARYQIDTARP